MTDTIKVTNTSGLLPWRKCVLCGEACEDAPTKRGWFDFAVYSKTVHCHFDCADWLNGTADTLRQRMKESEQP